MPGVGEWACDLVEEDRGWHRGAVAGVEAGEVLFEIVSLKISQIFLYVEIDDAVGAKVVQFLVAVGQSLAQGVAHVGDEVAGKPTGFAVDDLRLHPDGAAALRQVFPEEAGEVPNLSIAVTPGASAD